MSQSIAVTQGTKEWLTRLVVFAIGSRWPDDYRDRNVAWVLTGETPEPTPQDAP